MKKGYMLYYFAAVLFVIASILSFVKGATARGSIALVLALGMVLAGYRYQKRDKILDWIIPEGLIVCERTFSKPHICNNEVRLEQAIQLRIYPRNNFA